MPSTSESSSGVPPPGAGESSPPAGPAAMDPMVVIRSRSYLVALVLAAVLGIPISAVAYGFLALVSKIQSYLFDDLPDDVFADGAPGWWPVPLAGALRPADRADHPLPARQRRPLPRLRLPRRWRPAGRPGPARHHPRRADHAQPGRGARPRGAADRHRWRTCRADRAPGEEGRATDGPDHHGVGRQLRGDQHAARFPHARRLPDHGGGRHRRHDAEPGGTARACSLPASARWSSSAWTTGPDWASFSLALTSVPPAVDPTVATMAWALAYGRCRRPARLGDPLDRPVAAPARAPEPGARDGGSRRCSSA